MASIKRNYAYNILLNLSRVIFPLVTAPYISRVLEPDGIGLFNFASTYANYFALFAVLGIPTYGIREVAKIREDREALSRLVSELISVSLFSTLVVTAIYLPSIFLIGQLNENYVIFLVSGILLYLAPFRIDWFFSGLEQFGYITLRTLIIRTVSIACMFLFVHTRSDLLLYVILNVVGTVGGDVWNYLRLFRLGIKPRLVVQGLKQHLSSLFVLFTASIAISVYTVLDTLMLGFMTDYRETGFYNNPMHISRALLAVVTSLSAVAIPRISQYCKEGVYEEIQDLANKSFSVVAFLSVPIAVGIACIAPVFVPLFFGAEFGGSIAPLMALGFLVIAVGLNNLFGLQLLVAMNLDRFFLYSILAGTVTNFVLNICLIPHWGAFGASISSVVAEFLIVVVMVVFLYKQTFLRFDQVFPDLLKAFVGAVLFLPTIWILRHWLAGWTLVFAFFISGSFLFCISQKVLKNSFIEIVLPEIDCKVFKKNG